VILNQLLIGAILFCWLSPAGYAISPETKAVIKQAERLNVSGKTAEAYKLIDKYIEAHPKDADAYAWHGIMDNEHRKPQQCLDYLTKALQLSKGGKSLHLYQQVYIVRAYANMNLNRKNEAYADIEKARQINESNAEVFHIRGYINEHYGKLKQAFADYERGAPGHAICMERAATLADQLKLWDRRGYWLDQVCKIAPTFDRLNQRRVFQAQHGKMELAVEDAHRLLDMQPENREMHAFLVEALSQLGRYKDGIDAANIALKRFPGDLNFETKRADLELLSMHYDEAAKQYKKLLKKHPADAHLLEQYAVALRFQGRYEEAVVQFEKAAGIRNPDVPVLAIRAEAYRHSEQFKKCGDDYKQLYQKTSDRTYIVDAAQSWLSLGDYTKALKMFELALSEKGQGKPLSRSRVVHAYTCEAQCYLLTKQYQKSVERADKALSLGKGTLAALFCRSEANTKLGNYDAAIADLSEAIKLRPRLASSYHLRAKIFELKKMPEMAERDRKKASTLSRSLESDVFPSR